LAPSAASPVSLLRPGVILSAAVLFAPLLYPLATGRMFVMMDLAWFHIPVRYLYSQALAYGDSILWTPALFRGFYVHGEGQLGVMHPLHLVLYRWLPLSVAVGVELVAIYGVCFAGMRLCLRLAGLGAAAACFGGLLFAFSGFSVLHLNHINHLAVAAHMPWLVAAAECMLRPAAPRRHGLAFAGTAAVTGSAILFGSPQFLLMALLLAGGYAIVRAAMLRAWFRLPLLAAAVLAGIAIGGAQLLPTLDFLAKSDRSVAQRGFALTYSLHPWNLLQLWSPYVFTGRVYAEPAEQMVHELSIYNGAFCTVALFWLALRRHDSAERAVARLALALCAIGVVLALGRHGSVYPYLLNIPFFDRLRAPARFIVLVHFGLAVLGAVALEQFVHAPSSRAAVPWRKLWPLAVPVLMSAGIAVIALRAFTGPGVSAPHTATIPRLAAGLALTTLAAALFAGAARRQRLLIAVLPVFAAADLALWGYRAVWQPQLTLEGLARTADVPPGGGPGTVLSSPLLPISNVAVLQNYWLTHGYAGIVVPRALWTTGAIRHRLSGAEWIKSTGAWEPVPDTMPPARLVVDVRPSGDVARDVRAIDIARTALVDRTLPALSGTPGTARISTHRAGRIVVDVDSAARALLVLTETYDAGWLATDGERPLQTARANGDYLSAVVEPGTRSVTFTFAPPAVRHGIALSAAGVVAALAGALVLGRRRRQPIRSRWSSPC
jgi:hypothetical protein